MGSARFGVRLAGLVFVFFCLCGVATSAFAATTSDVAAMRGATARVDARCAGDTIFGELHSDAPAGSSFLLTLYQQRMKHGPWLSTNESVAIVTRRFTSSYPFSFDIASFNAYEYAIRGADNIEIIRASSCAPGHQVPEAPNVLLLAGAVAGVFGLSLVRRRRRWTF
jgi:hypothetical protein